LFTGRIDRPQLLAVLGPKQYLLDDPSVATTDEPLPPPAPPRAKPANARDADEAEFAESGGVTAIARNDDASVTSISDADLRRVASLNAPTPPVLVPHTDNNVPDIEPPPPNLRRGRFPMALPAPPPGFRADIRDRIPPAATPAPSRVPRQFQPAPTPGFSTPLPEFDAAEPPVVQGEPAISPALPEENLDVETPAPPPSNSPAAAVVQQPTQPASSDIPTAEHRVSFSTKTPRELMAEQGITQQAFELAPDPGRASPLKVGDSLELRTPDGTAVFTVRAKATVRAQAYLTDVPPAPIPQGLSLQSPVYVVRAEPARVQSNTAIAIHAPAGISADAFAQLKLYVYDADQGWIPLAGHRADPQALTFGGIDFGARTYALLAP